MSVCPELSGVDLEGNLVKIECLKHECDRYQQVQGTHPQTGETISDWGCAYNWTNTLLIENSKQQRHTASAVESFKNEMKHYNDKTIELIATDRLQLVSSQ